MHVVSIKKSCSSFGDLKSSIVYLGEEIAPQHDPHAKMRAMDGSDTPMFGGTGYTQFKIVIGKEDSQE
jgi:hypothetical protein